MLNSKLTLILAVAVTTSGCAIFNGSTQPTAPINSWNGSKIVFSGACKFSTAPPALATVTVTPSASDENFALSVVSALIPEFASKIIDFGAAYLEKVGLEFGASTTQASHLRLSRSTGNLGCLSFVVGQFGSGTPSGADGWTTALMDTFGLLKPPQVYAEWWISPADKGGTHIALQPGYVEYNATSAKRTSSGGSKDVTFLIQLTQPTSRTAAVPAAVAKAVPGAGGGPVNSNTGDNAAQNSEKAVAGYAINIPALKIGSKLNQRALVGTTTIAQPLALGSANELVTNVQITMLETENGGDFYLALAKFTKDTKPKTAPLLEDFFRSLLPKQQGK